MILFKNTLETVWVLCRQPFYKRDLSTRGVWDPGRPSWNPRPTGKKRNKCVRYCDSAGAQSAKGHVLQHALQSG